MVKNPPANAGDIETWAQSLGWGDALEEGKATHFSPLAWRTPRTEEPGGLQPQGCRVRHKGSDLDARSCFRHLVVLQAARLCASVQSLSLCLQHKYGGKDSFSLCFVGKDPFSLCSVEGYCSPVLVLQFLFPRLWSAGQGCGVEKTCGLHKGRVFR